MLIVKLKSVHFLALPLFVFLIFFDFFLVFKIQSTYDSGDSVLHFLQAHLAFKHPMLYLDHWAKPVFVLLSAPFAYFGWMGMKTFNALCMISSALCAFKLASKVNVNPWITLLCCVAAPKFILIQSSGLTEPLFTFLLIGATLLALSDRLMFATIIISFLPFVRSEGWLIIIMFAVYLLSIRKFSPLIWLCLGHIAYGLIGAVVLNDFLWMFHQNPYEGVELKYGNGSFTHYFFQLPNIVGLPIFILFLVSVLVASYSFFRRKLSIQRAILLFGIPLGYLAAHSIFWRFGMFHSFGITRVLCVLIPFIAIDIAWMMSTFKMKKEVRYAVIAIIICTVLIFPFTKNKMAFNMPHDFILDETQQTALNATNWIKHNNLDTALIFSNQYYLAHKLNLDIYNTDQFMNIRMLKEFKPQPGSLVIWDSYFAVTDAEVQEDLFENDDQYILLNAFASSVDSLAYEIRVYQVTDDLSIGN
ncbi:MAG: hypothetical protein ACI8ZN_001306 [Bacteroidia bacterium]|jgi:hypothetical protein